MNDNHTPPPPAPSTTITPAIGELVGRLKILDHIGSGGMADIYKVQHEELEVVRAIKMLKPGFDDETRSRFQTEAKISAHLDHPNIVHIYTVDMWQDKLPYIEMEYIDGPSLAHLIERQRRLPAHFALAVLSVLCQALEYAGGQQFTVYGKPYKGLVHRDIKPANVLISAKGTVKLADFGIALPGSVSLHTVGPVTLGTYAYLSPEQLDGGQLDQRSDIYSLGAVLYEMITGLKAFPDRNVAQLIRNKLSGNHRPANALVPSLPKSVSEIADKCLEHKMDARYKNLSELRAEVNAVLQELSGKSAESAVSRFVLNSEDERPVRTTAFEALSPVGRKLVVGVSIVAAVAFLVAGILLVRSVPRQQHDEEPEPVTVVEQRETTEEFAAEQPKPDHTIHTVTPIPTSPAHKATRTPAPHKKSSDTQDRASVASAAKAQKPHDKIGVEEFLKGNYEQAAHHLELALSSGPLTGWRHQIATLRLFESYLESGNMEKSLTFLESNRIDDAYFYLLEGRTYHKLGNPQQAETAFAIAQTKPSVLGDDVQREGVYWWAVNKETLYRRKPNTTNRTAVVKAWQSYSNTYCVEGKKGKGCAEAEKKVAEFGR